MAKALGLRREAIENKLKRVQTFLDAIDLEHLTPLLISELNVRHEKAVSLYDEFDEVQTEIEVASGGDEQDDLGDPLQIRDNFEESYYAVIGKIRHIFNEYDEIMAASQPKNGSISPHASNVSQTGSQAPTYGKIKLPTIELPKYDGNYCTWLSFRDQFKALVDGNEALSDSQKFWYLKRALLAKPLKVIESLEGTNENYKVAWKLLINRFENKKLIIHNHVKAIFELPVIRRESHVELRHLHDTINEHLRALKSLGEQTDSWDRLIIYIMTTKFDEITCRDWESLECRDALPTMEDMTKFLDKKCEVLEHLAQTSKSDNETKADKSSSSKFNKSKVVTSNVSANNKAFSCFHCKEEHAIYNCPSYLTLEIQNRLDRARELNLCLNCLRSGHRVNQCKSITKCKKCNKAHNTLLHFDKNPVQALNNTGGAVNSTVANCAVKSTCLVTGQSRSTVIHQTLLPTALVQIIQRDNTVVLCRALLDSGSQSNFMSESFCRQLDLPSVQTNQVVTGVGKISTPIKQLVNVAIKSCYNSFALNINCLVLQNITERLPSVSFDKDVLQLSSELNLADPTFNKNSKIDLLLGSSVFWTILRPGQMQLGNGLPVLQNSQFGWVVAGTLGNELSLNTNISVNCCATTADDEQNSKLQEFWKLEEVNQNTKILSSDEQFCEKHFAETVRRDSDGRFIVSIPLRDSVRDLGNSKEMALNRFYAIERKLVRNEELKTEYCKFMAEYLELNHMSEVRSDSNEIMSVNYLPHHAVVRTSSLTTKVRVVFDASAKTDSGVSFNEVQYVGPTLQDDIFSILVRFRKYKYVLSADVSKMYRQVLVEPKQRPLQRIFWRFNANDPVKCYELNTVTYGTAAAPYLAIKCLYQLGCDHEIDFPLVSKIIKGDFYVEDLLTGSDDASEIILIQKQITLILSRGGFELRKWLCNDQDILKQFQINDELDVSVLELNEDVCNKTLGVFWNAYNDCIQYSTNQIKQKGVISKRIILSQLFQIYDALGLLGPINIVAKIIMQDLWKLAIGWDEPVPNTIYSKWLQFTKDLENLSDIKIPRHVLSSEYERVEIHGFSDASERAYGACIYVRCLERSGVIKSTLMCAKSRVAPTKQVSLPRLELCGALLLARLSTKFKRAIQLENVEYFLWTDSTITLAWIKAESSRWKSFVANRVSEIQTLTSTESWYHVKSEENPADVLSRGTTARELKDFDLWWHGPEWLSTDRDSWKIPERRSVSNIIVNQRDFTIFTKFSSLIKLQRVVAFIQRFVKNCRLKRREDRQFNSLTSKELNDSLYSLIRMAQIESFPSDYFRLVNKQTLKSTSKLLSLNPFIGDDQLMRVGGRIQSAQVLFEQRHPIILPKKHVLTKLILEREHLRLLHCGVNTLLYSIRQRFWPIAGRSACKSVVKACITCFKVNPSGTGYLMGNLPKCRLNQTAPFYNVGLDYAGPFQIKDRVTRPVKLVKVYVCLFICMATKAVHLELVSDLTSNAFIATLKRFIARRGKPANVFSDNGLNFVGADNELQKLARFLQSESDSIHNYLSIDNIEWHFIPPKSPNFGGLWEAGVKSSKSHLKRVMGNANLTYEAFATVLTQIEAILNSRPICPISLDPNDLMALTPGHFLIGRPLTALPEHNFTNTEPNRLKQYQRLQALSQHFWKRWHQEYLGELQTRVKWRRPYENLQEGTLVLIKDENAPPLCWQLGRVIKVHPGQDGTVRVVILRTQRGELKRAVSQVCPLPHQSNCEVESES